MLDKYALDEARERAGMYPRYNRAQYVVGTPGQKEVWNIVEEYINSIPETRGSDRRPWTRRLRLKGLLLLGPAGTGKTLLGHKVLEAAIHCGHSALVVDFYQYVKATQQVMGQDLGREERLALREQINHIEYGDSHYMLIDDVGKEYSGPTNYAPLLFHQLMRTRGNNLLPVIVTTNLADSEIPGIYGESAFSYLHEVCRFVVMDGDDRRLLQ